MDKNREYILCAANYYNDKIVHVHSPFNISEGFVICGLRHHNCISTFALMRGFPYDSETLLLLQTQVQGFLTNQNRFVDRIEAARIAIVAEQIEDVFKKKLYSEDLY